MVLRPLIPFLLAIVMLQPLYAGDSVAVDTMRARVREVVVRDNAFLRADITSTQASTSLDAHFLKSIAPLQASDALSYVPGLAIRSYGGVGGMKTVSMRGGSAAQSLVMINGIRLSSAQNGQFDLSAVPMAMVDHVDVVRGGASALYGANAMTGVVNMSIAMPMKATAGGLASVGSFEEHHVNAHGSSPTAIGTIGASIDVLTSSGAFPYYMKVDGVPYDVNRENSDMHSLSGLLHYQPTDRWTVFALARSADRGVPGAVVQGSTTNARARMSDADVIGGVNGRIPLSSTSDLMVTLGTRYWDQRYVDPDATILGRSGLNERFILRDMATGVAFRSASEPLVQTYRVDASYADLRGATLQPQVPTVVQRRQIAVSGHWQWNVDEGVMVEGGLRADAISDAGTAVSPLLAARWSATSWLDVRTSASYNFRPPSFTELYYLNYGTATLRPERAVMLDAGCSVRPFAWLVCDVSAFNANTHDQIISVPTSPVSWSAQNVGQATTTGVEVGLRAMPLDERLTLHASYTRQEARDRTGRPGLDGTLLPYIPQELFNGGVHWKEDVLMMGGTWSYTSYRYALPGAQYASLVQPFTVVGIYVGAQARSDLMRIDVRLSVDNLLNEDYVVVRGYPMPGRTLRILTNVSL
ncbi:MAG: TonB-dependent receptor [Bacteroidetes bacterium]|nr:TonB-dependent receptor [Bacteroidota bacterium]